MEHNPYAPPKADLDLPAGWPEAQDLASQGQRFANYLLDTVGYYLLAMVFGVVIALIDESLLERVTTVNEWLFGILVFVTYYLVSESLFGLTVGKLITRTRVVSESGGRPSFPQVLGRTFARLVPFEPFSFFFNIAGWHDRWSGTRVIRRRRNPAD